MIQMFMVYICFLFLPIKKALHMYQQNRYRSDRFLFYMKQQIIHFRQHISFILFLFLYPYVVFLVDHAQRISVYVLLLVSFSYIQWKCEDHKKYIKPFVLTKRMIRLIICICLLYIFLLYCWMHLNENIVYICTPLLYGSSWIIIYICGMLIRPLENQIQIYYVNQAKIRLKDHEKLFKIAITGSYGKTSIKHFLYHILKEKWLTLMTPASYNNRMSISSTILSHLKPLHEVFICECGSDHAGEIGELCRLIDPDLCVVSEIGNQHLQTFHTMQTIIDEKMSMVEEMCEDGIAFLNYDNAYIYEYPLQNTCRIISYGEKDGVDYQICGIQYDQNGTSFQIRHQDELFDFHTNLYGKHTVCNICVTIAIAHTLSIPMDVIQACVETMPAIKHRLEKIELENYTVFDDAYNSNPIGARYALDVLKQMPNQRILITCGFVDLGVKQEFEMETYGMYMADCVDEVILVGKCMDILKGLKGCGFSSHHIHMCANMEEAFSLMRNIVKKGGYVLIENDVPDMYL